MNAKEVTDMMDAYASIYEKTEEQVIDEDLQGAVEKGLDAAAKNPVIKAIGKVIAPVGKGRKTPTKTSGGYRPVAKEEVEVIDEEPVQDYRDMKRAKENAAGMRGSELTHSTKSTGGGSAKQKPQPRSREFSHGGSSQPRSREFSHGGSSQPRSREFAHKEEVETDLFDIILEYLVAEGFADTNQSALVIMANMSEEWRQSIVEDIRGNSTLTPVGKAIGTGVGILKGAMGDIKSGGGYSTRPGDGKPYKDGPLWGPGSSSTPKTPVKKPSSQAPMRDEPLW